MSSPYQQQGYFPQQPVENRRRSSSYTDRYRPSSYSNSPQADPSLLAPHQYSGSPMAMPSPYQQQPPYPVDQPAVYSPYLGPPNMAQHQLGQEMGLRRPSVTRYPDGTQRPSYDGSQQRRPSATMYPDGLQRPSYDGSQPRRLSHDSRRSHHSHHSQRSHSSRRPRYEEDDDEDESPRGEHHHHHHNHEHKERDDIDEYRRQKKERGDNVSRSLGGSLMAVFEPLKYLFEPRDKY